MNPNDKEWMIIAILVGVLIFFGTYLGSQDPEYRYFERDGYITRYESDTNSLCFIPETPEAEIKLVQSGGKVCETPWAARMLGLDD